MRKTGFKHILSLLSAILMLVCIFPFADAAAVPGDIDGDRKTTSVDARLALRASVGLEKLNAAQKTAADVDFDGKITLIYSAR